MTLSTPNRHGSPSTLIPVVPASDSTRYEATDSGGMKPPRDNVSLERSRRPTDPGIAQSGMLLPNCRQSILNRSLTPDWAAEDFPTRLGEPGTSGYSALFYILSQ